MAFSSSLPEDLTCPVCFDIFEDPVILKCSHSFCKACLRKCWEENKAGECPVCRDKTTEDPVCNRALKNLCETFLISKIEKPASRSESLCSVHGEKLKLFCVNDQQLICAICQTSKKHKKHKLRPVQEAALKYKEEVEKALRLLEEKLKAFTEVKQESDRDAEFIKSQAICIEMVIQEEFEILHQFLRDEEAARISALKEEEEQKSHRMKERAEKMTKEISSLSEAIRALEQEMRADDLSFLQNYKATMRRTKYKVSDPEEVSGEHIDVIKHKDNLKYRVWEKMEEIVQNNAQLETEESGASAEDLYCPVPEVACSNEDLRKLLRSRFQGRPKEEKPAKEDDDSQEICARAIYDYQADAQLETEESGASAEDLYCPVPEVACSNEDLRKLLWSRFRGPPKEEKPAKEDDDSQEICARAIYDYQAVDDADISLNSDDIITGILMIDQGWWMGYSSDGRFGMFPSNYVALI
ncbi:hypothetical protein SKAU_G00076580 [Synaphobranchus kaupii]|uniref:Uncharacterized protein n=1 Tax=Synaphobranchus kaupii TaxID=118154 RepID=A0A9Q1G7T5_SYNKA|nr:hypothetical protein SKAU_G00076580 [Synaphobranchus kaupii]